MVVETKLKLEQFHPKYEPNCTSLSVHVEHYFILKIMLIKNYNFDRCQNTSTLVPHGVHH